MRMQHLPEMPTVTVMALNAEAGDMRTKLAPALPAATTTGTPCGYSQASR